MTRTIAIATPTGNVGSKIISHLVSAATTAEVEIVVLARKAGAVARWARRNVRVYEGRLEDPGFLVQATRGVDALYWATPNSFAPELTIVAGYRQFAESAATAIRANAIAHVVHLSGFAHVDDGGGAESLLRALADTEAILGATVDEVGGITHVRSGFLFENFLGQLESIRENGRIYLPVNMKRRIPMVASQDVARIAAEALLGDVPRGRLYRGAWGPEDLSFAQVASALTIGLGRTIRVIRLPRFMIRAQMLRLGRDPRAVDAFMHSFRAISKGRVSASPVRDTSSTTPTHLSRWAADVLQPIIDGAEGAACPVRVQYEPHDHPPTSESVAVATGRSSSGRRQPVVR